MLRVALFMTPAWMPALLFSSVLLLQGCSLLPKKDETAEAGTQPVAAGASAAEDDKPDAKRDAFTLEVHGPDAVREHLALHLEIQRYRQIPDLGATELSRLMVAAEANARELLGTLGYFTPRITLELKETPDGKAPREVVVTVDPGEPARVGPVEIGFGGAVADDPSAAAQREAVRSAWTLRTGQLFTQQAWDDAKTLGLRSLTAKRYATASVGASRAAIDADRGEARLEVNYDSGPAYRFGPLQIHGTERYAADGARRIARVPTGSEYDQQKLLDAQQRLASSGYYDSVFLTLDTAGTDPTAAPVIAQVREAPLQKVVLGAGFTTDSGPRLSIDHVHNQMPLLGWRAVSRLSVDHETQSLGTDWNAIPDDKGWRWFGSGLLKRESAGTYDVDSGRVRGGRGRTGDRIDRSYFLQYDYANNRGEGAPPSASALSVNWGWTGRYFDDNGAPTRGQGLALELGLGQTLIGERAPFLRSYARWLGILPIGSVRGADGGAARSSRLQFRAEAGAVIAKDSAQIPSTLMFLTGGDTTVRGYSYRQIGTERADGSIVAGRYLGVASVEWQRPIVWNGKLSDWESAAFVDAGSVADKAGALDAKVGVGVGARWRSPVGPVQADIAYGVDVKKYRLHLRLGFTF
jgi:translocation and assembly module TamA